MAGVNQPLKVSNARPQTRQYIKASLAEHVAAKSDGAILPTIIADTTTSDSLDKLVHNLKVIITR